MSRDYSKDYISLKNRINSIKLKILSAPSNDNNNELGKQVNGLGKELDMLYSENRYFDELEIKVKKLEKTKIIKK
jgi:hypothetical protein